MLTYEQTRPWAAAMSQAVKTKKMPPWFADPQYGKFSNATALTQAEIDTIAAWVEAGAPKGDAKDMPAPANSSRAGKSASRTWFSNYPSRSKCRPSGVVDYQHVIVPTGFTQDTWVQAAEVRPTDRAVVHHIIAFIREPESNWFKGAEAGRVFYCSASKDERGARHQRAAERLSGGLCARPAGGNFAAGPSQADQGRLRYRVPGALHSQRQAGQRSNQARPGAGERAAARARADAFGDERNIQDSCQEIRTIEWTPRSKCGRR